MSTEKKRQQIYFVFLDLALQSLHIERRALRRELDATEFREHCTVPRMLPEHRRREVAAPYNSAYFEPRRAFYLRNEQPEPELDVLSLPLPLSASCWWKDVYRCQRADAPGKSSGGLFVVLGLPPGRALVAARHADAASTRRSRRASSSLKRGATYVPNARALSVKKLHRVKVLATAEDPLRPEHQIRIDLERKLRRKVARAAASSSS